MEGESRYCVLYTQAVNVEKAVDAIRRYLPEDRGLVFYPRAELWMRGAKYETVGHTVLRPLFPGYIFLRSALSQEALHEAVRRASKSEGRFFRELSREGPGGGGESGLAEDEAEFLDFLLGFRGSISAEAGRTPEAGVIRMSEGYLEEGRPVVMEGPLKGLEDRIADVRKRDRKAYLRLTVGGHTAKAGLMLYGKRYYFPEDKDAPYLLMDGTEVDTEKIAKRMMRNQ